MTFRGDLGLADGAADDLGAPEAWDPETNARAMRRWLAGWCSERDIMMPESSAAVERLCTVRAVAVWADMVGQIARALPPVPKRIDVDRGPCRTPGQFVTPVGLSLVIYLPEHGGAASLEMTGWQWSPLAEWGSRYALPRVESSLPIRPDPQWSGLWHSARPSEAGAIEARGLAEHPPAPPPAQLERLITAALLGVRP